MLQQGFGAGKLEGEKWRWRKEREMKERELLISPNSLEFLSWGVSKKLQGS